MIKKIIINKLGRFNNFTFDGVNDFRRFNVIYGWNYSGKTTLSRAFSTFDTKTIPMHYEDGFDITFEFDDGTKLNPKEEIDINRLTTKVFNSDYVEENLFFEDSGASNILVLANNAQDTMTKIELLKKEIKLEIDNITKFKKQLSENKKFLEEKRSNEARKIKERLHCTFTAGTFSSYERKLKEEESIESHIIKDDEELCKKRSMAIAEKNKSDILQISPIQVIDIEKVKDLLNETVNIATPLSRLSDNKEAEKWVREGLPLHKDINICLYCGHPLDESIIKELNEHFDKSYSDFISRIEIMQQTIKTISSFNDIIPDTSKFYEQFENKYLKEKEELENLRIEYNKVIKRILTLFEKKLKTVTQPIEYNIDYDFSKINTQIKKINNGVIKEHNDFNNDFEKQKGDTIDELCKHYVSEIIIGRDYVRAEEIIDESNANIEKTNKEIKEKEEEIQLLEAKISESVAGAEKVNTILKRLFMGKSEIELAQKTSKGNENKYVLKRNGEIAHHLSDGEKTAISFAHFLASLDSKDLIDKCGNVILYIDDPISSLDNNHIYAIFSEISRLRNEEFMDSDGKKQKRYKQLFISTHNYHLFSLLTERPEKQIEIYYIQRNKVDSIITNFPKNLLKQKAEYSFLFYQIKSYIENPNEDDYIIGHFLRRFLEIFTTYKNPTKSDLRKRIDDIVNLKDEYKADEVLMQTVYKTINEESHTYITNEVINNGSIKETAEAVLKFVKMVDPDQYFFLEKNCNSQE